MPDDVRSPDSPELADPMVRPRYTGLPTFMRVPYREDPVGIDIGVIGVPFDGATMMFEILCVVANSVAARK